MTNFSASQLEREARPGSVDLRGTLRAGAFGRKKFYACVPVQTMGEIHIIVQSPTSTTLWHLILILVYHLVLVSR